MPLEAKAFFFFFFSFVADIFHSEHIFLSGLYYGMAWRHFFL